jgi:hypothetical protein
VGHIEHCLRAVLERKEGLDEVTTGLEWHCTRIGSMEGRMHKTITMNTTTNNAVCDYLSTKDNVADSESKMIKRHHARTNTGYCYLIANETLTGLFFCR